MNKPLGLEMNLLPQQGPFWGIWMGAQLPGSLGEESSGDECLLP